jgi:hypothetical protein
MPEKNFTEQSTKKSSRKTPRPFIPAWVREILPAVKGAPLSVLNVYWSRASKDGLAWPSIKTLTTDTGYGEVAVKKARKLLIEMRLLVPIQQARSTGGRYGKKEFRVVVPWYQNHTAAPQDTFSTSPRDTFDTPTVVSKPYQEGLPVEGTPIRSSREAAAAISDSVLEGGDSPLQTTPEEKTCRSEREAWEAIGIEGHGPPRYRNGWVKTYQQHRETTPSEKLSDVMERFIRDCENQQIKIPHAFYAAKRAVEAREGRLIPPADSSVEKGKFDDIPIY